MVQKRPKFFPIMEKVSGDELAKVRLSGFAIAFDRLTKERAFDFNA